MIPAELFRRILNVNPFTDNRVNEPSEEDIDVAELNRSAFDRLTALAREALAERRGIGAMLWGEAGVGKSHLLSRLVRWARAEGGCPIYLHNLQASPSNLPRVLLRSVVSHLTWSERSSFSGTTLFQMIGTALRRGFGETSGMQSWNVLRRGLLEVLIGDPSGPADAGLADATVPDILFRFYRSVHRAAQRKEDGTTATLAVQWLRGEPIPAQQAHDLLGLPSARHADAVVIVEDSQRIKNILAALTRLAAACDQPFLLCFDQFDNLEPEQAGALARFLEALIDSSRDLLVVTAGIQPTLMGWHEGRIIQDSAWDRLAQSEIQLLKLTPLQARRLVETRLQHFFEPFEEVPELRRQRFEDALFPLGTGWFEQYLGEALELRPREVLNAAREAWYREQGWLNQQGGQGWLAAWKQRQTGEEAHLGPVTLNEQELNELIDRTIAERMTEHVGAIRGKPIDRDSLAEVLVQLLEECRRIDPTGPLVRVLRPEEVGDESPSAYHFLLDHQRADGSEVRTGVVVAAGAKGNGVFYILSRLLEDLEPPPRLLIIAGDTGLVPGEKGEQYLKDLRERASCKLEILSVSSVELNTLDALNATWNMARSEDLEFTLPDGRALNITPDQVMDSHQRNGRLAASVVLTMTLGAPPSTEPASAAEEELAMSALAESLLAEPLLAAPVAEPQAAEEDLGATLLLAEPVLDLSAASPVPVGPTMEKTVQMSPLEDAALDEIILSPGFEMQEAEAIEEAEAEAILLSEEPGATMPIEEAEEEGEAIVLSAEPEETLPFEEAEAEAILLSGDPGATLAVEEIEAEAILLDEEPEATLSVEGAEAEALLLEDEPQLALPAEEEVDELLLEDEPEAEVLSVDLSEEEIEQAIDEAEAILREGKEPDLEL